MEHATSLLYDLEGFRVAGVTVNPLGIRVLLLECVQVQGCPDCGTVTERVHSHRMTEVRDLPFGRPWLVRWDKRRMFCDQVRCPRRTFVERSTQLGPRQRLTARLRSQLERAVSGSRRAASDVAREYGVSWWSVNHALVVAAARVCGPAPEGVRLLGVDETRARSVRWMLSGAGWKRSDPWMTSFVDLDPAHPGGLLGLAPGRSGASVRGWLGLQSQAFRDGIEVVAIDPSAPFARALRELLPGATMVVDHWHLHRLAALMLTEVRQRATRERLGQRGRLANDVWAYRRLLLRAGDSLTGRQKRRLHATFRHHDPTGEILHAWAGKELLRHLLAKIAGGARPYEIRERLDVFYSHAARADIPELTRFATTIDTWWPAVEAFLRLRVTNARTEGYNTNIKLIKRTARGFRSQANYQRRILLANAATAA